MLTLAFLALLAQAPGVVLDVPRPVSRCVKACTWGATVTCSPLPPTPPCVADLGPGRVQIQYLSQGVRWGVAVDLVERRRVQVRGTSPPGTIFADGFETGDVGRWR